jgi:hypothetical protein
MRQLTFETFAAAAKVRGFDEVLERKWQPSLVLDTHTHPFALKALVVQGEMWLVVSFRLLRLLAQCDSNSSGLGSGSSTYRTRLLTSVRSR